MFKIMQIVQIWKTHLLAPQKNGAVSTKKVKQPHKDAIAFYLFFR